MGNNFYKYFQGAIAGMIASHVVTTWITVGHLMYDTGNVAMLPLSTSVRIC